MHLQNLYYRSVQLIILIGSVKMSQFKKALFYHHSNADFNVFWVSIYFYLKLTRLHPTSLCKKFSLLDLEWTVNEHQYYNMN